MTQDDPTTAYLEKKIKALRNKLDRCPSYCATAINNYTNELAILEELLSGGAANADASPSVAFEDGRQEMGRQMKPIFRAAWAVVKRWETPLWKDVPATAGYIHALRDSMLNFPEEESPDVIIAELVAALNHAKGFFEGAGKYGDSFTLDMINKGLERANATPRTPSYDDVADALRLYAEGYTAKGVTGYEKYYKRAHGIYQQLKERRHG